LKQPMILVQLLAVVESSSTYNLDNIKREV
jgi:hypothetical protein